MSSDDNEYHLQRKKKRQLIEWRRSIVESLLVKGLNTYEISAKLQISQSTISRDAIYLRHKAKEDLRNHIDDKLPDMYNQYLTGVTEVLKLAWQIANGECTDNKTRLQALSLVNECYKHRMDLLTNSSVLTDAIRFIEQSKEKLRITPSNNEGKEKSSAEQEEEHESKILKAMRLVNQLG